MWRQDLADRALAVLVLFGFVACLGVAGYSDAQQEEAELRMYCQQVEASRASGGEHGWPDYDNLYDRECK